MRQRIKLGLVFKYDESWVAGSYYILNLLHALKTLPTEKQPEIVLFTDTFEDQKKVAETSYPFITNKIYTPRLNTFEKLINKISRTIFHINLIEKRMKNKDIDFIFIQRRSWETDLISNTKKIFWIPDCQELIMPELFFKRELDGRKHVYNEIITSKSKVLFSSYASFNDFRKFYPKALNPMKVVHFAVVHPSFKQIARDELLVKYQIKQPYFMVPNQFWVHKNHKIVLEAASKLKNQHSNFKIIFTGKENDFRAPNYTNELKQFVLDHDLSDVISFLGFIPREEQLCLMQHSVAVIQPSLFEGWSTVVEDTKALNKWILLSDIEVHKEQINENVDFFNPKDALQLSEMMKLHLETTYTCKLNHYQKNLQAFGQGFYEILTK